MNFHDKKEIPPKYIYLFLAVICFILLFFSVIFESRFSPLKAVTSAIITPMQSGINEVGTSIYNRVTNTKEKEVLLSENKELQTQLDEYLAQIKVYEQESYELNRLQELLKLKEQYTDFRTIGARVIATDSTNWFSTFVIDKGKDDGVQVGCNILAGNGLAGIVTEVGTNYSKVRAIIDDNSSVSAGISGTETLCTVTGNLSSIKEGYINIGYINKADTIEEGAELVTSHVSSKFLPGILIGYITEVKMDANNLTKSAKCIPVVDFSNLQEVLVVLDLKADYHTDSVNKNIYDNITNTEETSGNNTGERNSEDLSSTEEGSDRTEENSGEEEDTRQTSESQEDGSSEGGSSEESSSEEDSSSEEMP